MTPKDQELAIRLLQRWRNLCIDMLAPITLDEAICRELRELLPATDQFLFPDPYQADDDGKVMS